MPQKNILDGNLVGDFINLSLKEKHDFAKQIGTTVGQVIYMYTHTIVRVEGKFSFDSV